LFEGGQVVLLRQYLRKKNFFDVNVGTIENYQGVEQDVIIFSLTRSNPLFVHHDIKKRMGVFGEVRYKQANVALTRAENLFIMVGNPVVCSCLMFGDGRCDNSLLVVLCISILLYTGYVERCIMAAVPHVLFQKRPLVWAMS
jgi:superfamily I DNA and/or RNA helicase